jgi:hypothetical protein
LGAAKRSLVAESDGAGGDDAGIGDGREAEDDAGCANASVGVLVEAANCSEPMGAEHRTLQKYNY